MFCVTTRLRFIEPQLPSLVEQPPEGKHWIHEVKHDGYRDRERAAVCIACNAPQADALNSLRRAAGRSQFRRAA